MSVEHEKAELQQVLHSPQFRRAPKLQRFLELICDYHFQNRREEITEFLIATTVFGKGPQFDPSDDSLVRVQAREIRRRLREYYQNEGAASRIVLDIPVGSYLPAFTEVALPAKAGPRASLRASWVMIGVTALICAALLLAADHERRLLLQTSKSAGRTPDTTPNPSLTSLWKRFLDSDVSTLLVVSNPDVGECAEQKKEAGNSDSCEEYTGMGEAVAIHLLTNMFRSARSPLIMKQSRIVTADDVKQHHLILLGGKQVNIWTRRLGPDLTLRPVPDLSRDQARQYSIVVDQSGQLTNDRGILALRKNASTGYWLLFLYGHHSEGTRAAAEASIDGRFLSEIQWPAAPFPESFRVLIGVAVNDGIPQAPVPVAVRVP